MRHPRSLAVAVRFGSYPSAVWFVVAAAMLLACAATASAADPAEKLQFNRDIRPILVDNCFACHGPDASTREADLRLDVREEAVAFEAIVPGEPDRSSMIRRVLSGDPKQVMPPPKSHKKLTAAQKELLRRWVAEGAEYQGHWSYLPPVRSETPAGEHPIDHLVRKELARLKLQPAAEADRRTLIRRLSFDLLGLPPTPAEVEAFVNDKSPEAYERLVDRLLASPHYGERMAIGWLDVVRFADTIGYHSDNPRNIWPYRDYVIRAFNENKPYDQFTIEQLAGDLLDNSTNEHKVASAFNRLLLTTEEGGAQARDYEARMLGDRVRAVGAVWLGQTLGCAQCHDHKFDPSKAADFYAMGAFFADIQEPIIGRREEGMPLLDEKQEQELAQLRAAIASLQKEYDAETPSLKEDLSRWIAEQEKLLAAAEAKKNEKKEGDKSDDKTQATADKSAAPQLPADVLEALKTASDKRSAKHQQSLLAHYKSLHEPWSKVKPRLDATRKAETDLLAAAPKCLVSRSGPPRTVRILPRGNWLDNTGPVVQPAFLGYLPQPKVEDEKRRLTRLDLARWIVSEENPLPARVFVNRLWTQFFGSGISRTLDDFGSQGEWPTHPELLDWLAVEFREKGWDVKHLVRTIVTSATYRQTSVASPELLARDPENRLLARQGRFRLDAELVRDNALAISGLLVQKIGGPSVKPYQPDTYWENLNFPTRKYDADTGAGQHRRGLYTWWQRSFLHPSLLAFDAPTREECAAERTRSNIPQQALVLLNDPIYVEAARSFAARIVAEGGKDDDARIGFAWLAALDREPSDKERAIAERVLAQHRADYQADPKAAEALLSVGIAPRPADVDPAELAAWTSVARVILNLHETITRN